MKKIIVFLQFLLIFSFCSDNSMESEIIDTPNTTTNFIEATTTTLIDEKKTTTSTVRMITDTVVSDIKIEILNCPSEKVNIEIGELFELQFSVQAGFADIVSIFYLLSSMMNITQDYLLIKKIIQLFLISQIHMKKHLVLLLLKSWQMVMSIG